MSSPPDSISDVEDTISNKKRGRAQSAEPQLAKEAEQIVEETASDVSASKKTKRVEETAASMSTIRRNLKDMSTTDEMNTEEERNQIYEEETKETANPEGEEDSHSVDTPMSQYNERKRLAMEDTQDSNEKASQHPISNGEDVKDDEEASPRKKARDTFEIPSSTDKKDSAAESIASANLSRFGGKGDEDDWGEFAEELEENQSKAKTSTETKEKPKYAFGTTSGFGTKGWASSHITSSVPSKPSFGGFAASSFGAFSQKTAPASSTSPPTASPSFGSFAKASVSPFVLAAASTTTNALSSPSNIPSSPATTTADAEEAGLQEKRDQSTTEDNEESAGFDEDYNASETGTSGAIKPVKFGDAVKSKPLNVKPKEVKTGEENERTIYQTKAKLLVLDTVTSNWKERGAGTLRINTSDRAQDNSFTTRLVMRADSVFRLILNVKIFPGMQVFIMQEKFVRFAGFETETKDGKTETKLVNYALRVSNAAAAEELRDQIAACVPPSSIEPKENA
ncbi:hypothetical protein EC973_005570 [Apophysomyces ossiformis]|uniref:RanBD1 domain-containing protein n=1 Tax=Apophysomyces ossiformis TaxID=679940 RepID=A0A8H7BW29_9FUNG|nr:hypothetical protein EC973_005570 [Apophysomyces ossiformis]